MSVEISESIFPNYSSEIMRIEREGISSEVIDRIIDKHEPKRLHMKALYNRWCTTKEGVPIFTRKARADVVNNKINNDYFGEIVSTKIGYFAGTPFSYQYSKVDVNNEMAEEEGDAITEQERKKNIQIMKHFTRYSNISKADVTMSEMAEIVGYASRLLYVDKDGEETLRVLQPWNCVHLSRSDITEAEYGLIEKFGVEVYRNGEYKTVDKVEFYDSENVYFYEKGDNGWVEDPDEKQPVLKHMFDYCPLQGIPNNEEMLGGAEKVLSIIDAIDRALSDCNSEIEAFKLAYMVIAGGSFDDEDELEKCRETGCFQIPTEGVEISYLTKEINDDFVENHLTRLDKAIYKFSKTPDLSDSNITSASSGISMKFKLFGLETRCMIFERMYEKANRQMFKILGSAWKKKGYNFDHLECDTVFGRTFPLDTQYEATTLQLLEGRVSKDTALGLMSFVPDPAVEIEKMKKEAEDDTLGINWNEIEDVQTATRGITNDPSGNMPKSNLQVNNEDINS